MVMSDFRTEVERRPFRACAMKNMQYNIYINPSVMSAPTLAVFGRRLKTELFRRCYNATRDCLGCKNSHVINFLIHTYIHITNENITFLAEVKREEVDYNMLMNDVVTDYHSLVHSYSVSLVPCRNTMSQALDSMKHETEKMAEVHMDLSSQLFSSAQRMTEFVVRQKAEIKQV